MSDLLETLQQEGVDPALLEAVQQYRAAHALPDALRPRIPSPAFTYYGKQVWEQALAALLCAMSCVCCTSARVQDSISAMELVSIMRLSEEMLPPSSECPAIPGNCSSIPNW